MVNYPEMRTMDLRLVPFSREYHRTMAPKEQNEQQQQTIESNPTLRICCYGSSSSRTQERYTNDAYNLGYALVQRGHTCVNGAGRFGCMGALNKGAEDASNSLSSSLSLSSSTSKLGKVVGVIHEMFIKETAHGEGGRGGKGGSDIENNDILESNWMEKCAPVFSTCENAEIHVAGGNDLQERKRMLVEGADALIVMPGGPGTFDEVWEMACSKQIGIINIPIVCVNIDGYYDPFHLILQRAHEDQFLYKHPEDILHFEPTSQKALEWIEKMFDERERNIEEKSATTGIHKKRVVLTRQKSLLNRMMSTFNLPSSIFDTSTLDRREKSGMNVSLKHFIIFGAGLALGLTSSGKKRF